MQVMTVAVCPEDDTIREVTVDTRSGEGIFAGCGHVDTWDAEALRDLLLD